MHTALLAEWRVESRTGAVTVVSRWLFDWAFAASPQSGLAWFCFLFPLIEPDWQISRSRKRLTRSPTDGSRSGVVTGPSHTQSAETLPEIVCMPVAALCVGRITTDAASGGRVSRPHCRLC